MPTTADLSDIMTQQSNQNSLGDEYIYESDEDDNDLESDDDTEADAVMSYAVDSSTDVGYNQSSYNISISDTTRCWGSRIVHFSRICKHG